MDAVDRFEVAVYGDEFFAPFARETGSVDEVADGRLDNLVVKNVVADFVELAVHSSLLPGLTFNALGEVDATAQSRGFFAVQGVAAVEATLD